MSDVRNDSGEKPILQVSRGGDVTISRRAIVLLATLAGVPGGLAIWSARDADNKADAAAGVSAEASAGVQGTFDTLRREQLDDRKALADTREVVNKLVDEVKILRAAVASVLGRRGRAARPEPEKLPTEPRAPLPPSPAAAATSAHTPPATMETR